jgi:hypothetical protein
MASAIMGTVMKLRIFTLCALAALAACHRNSSTSSPVLKSGAHAKAPAAPPPKRTAREQTQDMVEAATLGKSQAPVGLKFEVLQRPVQGQPLEIGIALLPQVPARSATIEVTGSEALQIGAGENQIEFAEVEPDEVYRHSIKLIPTAEGVFLVTLNVSLKHDQMADSRVFSVPIIVAPSIQGTAHPPGTAAHPQGSAGSAADQPLPGSAGAASSAADPSSGRAAASFMPPVAANQQPRGPSL